MAYSVLSLLNLLICITAAVHVAPPQGFPPSAAAGRWVSPVYPWLFQSPLPLPAVAIPSYTSVFNGTAVDFYTSSIEKFQAQIYPNRGPTDFVGFNATSPGPTYRIQRGRETIVRQTNNGNNPSSTHLHGSWTRSPWDGWADDTVPVGHYKDYYYPNSQQARTMWYHDHADNTTAVDAYYGQNGFYIIYDPAEDALQLPRGKYDIPISLMDRRYNNDGQLYSPASEKANFYGDIIHANGQPWPYLKVEPRKYRIRFLNTCLSRTFELFFNDDSTGTRLPVNVIASDGGLFAAPVKTTTIEIAMGERYEVIIDFADFAGKNITVGNDQGLLDILNFDSTNQVMRFVVGHDVSDTSNNVLPSALPGGALAIKRTHVDHVFKFQRSLLSGQWSINGVVFNNAKSRVLARPPQGTTENWQLSYDGGPGVHPVHVHLIDFRIVSRTGGTRGVLPYEAAGEKDIVLLEPGEVVHVVAKYGPWNGLYQFHCHNLIHEDHNMMAAMNVTALQALGYSDAADYANPIDSRFGPRPYNAAEYSPQYITGTLMPSMAALPAYRDLSSIASGLASFWSTRPGGETALLPSAQATAAVLSAAALSATTTTTATVASTLATVPLQPATPVATLGI